MSSLKYKQGYDWDIEATKLLISLYKGNECLYNSAHEDYKNRDLRHSALTQIAIAVSDEFGKKCSVRDVRKKVNTLRSQYHVEKLKMIKSASEGSNYTPTVYWFPLLGFLDGNRAGDFDSMLRHVTPESSHMEDSEPHHHKRPKLEPESSGTFHPNAFLTPVPLPHTMAPEIANPITAFCNFMKMELVSIEQTGGAEYVKKAKRKLQMALFEVWDEMDTKKSEGEVKENC